MVKMSATISRRNVVGMRESARESKSGMGKCEYRSASSGQLLTDLDVPKQFNRNGGGEMLSPNTIIEENGLTTTVPYAEIKGLPWYRFGSDGSVWSGLRPNRNWPQWKQMRTRLNSSGYVTVGLVIAHRASRTHLLHNLILEAFRGPRPPGMNGCHNNGDPLDCRIDNLRWDTQKSNIADKKKHGTYRSGTSHHSSKMTHEDMARFNQFRAKGWKAKALAAEFGISTTAVYRIISEGRCVILPPEENAVQIDPLKPLTDSRLQEIIASGSGSPDLLGEIERLRLENTHLRKALVVYDPANINITGGAR